MLLSRSALRRAGLLTLAIAATLALAACSSSDASVIQATAGEDFTLTLVNDDSAPHNWALYTEEGGDTIVTGDVAEPGETVTVDVSGLDEGTYFFKCDIHPEMNGSVEVSA